ncbi:amino acid--[acyl-carrier-protein] ligase [Pleionea litopenaei]|uniref:Amino acid--[acyl-carrier-protein] ligase n=1 Tax=Pleionea litopenaei TaxID=3070815 RepID=A0AA51RRF8_9GAMM|nr:amino acid--[acyl-carrier-protein] ligase [Pleionea sp. HL-JVS1]WMS86180.1 amino acid--[acyl-carrier-protein] ligase [Pleionea sp. HL-JVS1]
MCNLHGELLEAYDNYRNELLDAGLLLGSGVEGVYGLSGTFEGIIEAFERYVTREGAELKPEVMRFPPILNRKTYLSTDHIETMPDLMGSIHTFKGTQLEQLEMIDKKNNGEDWTVKLAPADVMMVPAACYPLYPTAANTVLPEEGRLVDLRAFVFRHEPSPDPARMQIFRQREYVRLGTPEQARSHRDYWLNKGQEMLKAIGLPVQAELANDPFFGRGGRVMAATQKEQELKFELVVPVATDKKLTAISSSNCHLDHFGKEFNIQTQDGNHAHTACIGFGLERITLALLKTHGLDPEKWPAEVKQVLDI